MKAIKKTQVRTLSVSTTFMVRVVCDCDSLIIETTESVNLDTLLSN